jgi:hypothetical protein
MPLSVWKSRNEGKYFYRIHYKNLTSIDYVSEKIIKLAKKNENFYIFLDDSLEGYAYLNFKFVYEFVLKNGLQNKVLYLSGHSDVDKEHQNWIKSKKLKPIFYVMFYNSWFWRNRDWAIDHNVKCKTEKSVWYSCLNNRPREHRLAAVTYLDYLDILKSGIVSANEKDYEVKDTPFSFQTIIESVLVQFDKNYQDIVKQQMNLTYQKLPLIVDALDLSNKSLPHDLSPKVYNYTLVNLVTETYYFKCWNSHSEMFITEKTWKAFTAKQIPIIIGPRGILDKLRSYGFDVFDDIVDNSYDNEPSSTRLFSAINSLNKLIKNYDVRELSKITEERRLKNLNFMFNEIPLELPIWSCLECTST